jgi:hypothetical protein
MKSSENPVRELWKAIYELGNEARAEETEEILNRLMKCSRFTPSINFEDKNNSRLCESQCLHVLGLLVKSYNKEGPGSHKDYTSFGIESQVSGPSKADYFRLAFSYMKNCNKGGYPGVAVVSMVNKYQELLESEEFKITINNSGVPNNVDELDFVLIMRKFNEVFTKQYSAVSTLFNIYKNSSRKTREDTTNNRTNDVRRIDRASNDRETRVSNDRETRISNDRETRSQFEKKQKVKWDAYRTTNGLEINCKTVCLLCGGEGHKPFHHPREKKSVYWERVYNTKGNSAKWDYSNKTCDVCGGCDHNRSECFSKADNQKVIPNRNKTSNKKRYSNNRRQ